MVDFVSQSVAASMQGMSQ